LPALNSRFANTAIIVIGITTAIFIVMQYISFLITGQEQTTMIEMYFNAVVIECGRAHVGARHRSYFFPKRKKGEAEKTPTTESEDEEL
jgi:hypothetical protein